MDELTKAFKAMELQSMKAIDILKENLFIGEVTLSSWDETVHLTRRENLPSEELFPQHTEIVSVTGEFDA